MSEAKGYDDHTNSQTEELITGYVERFFALKPGEDVAEDRIRRIAHNIWSIREETYDFNIIITSMLVIFDARLFFELPQDKITFYEELLGLNAHVARTSKLCLVKDPESGAKALHLRVLRGLEDFDYSEFKGHVEEFRELYPELRNKLIRGYYPDLIKD